MSLPERIELRSRWAARKETIDACAVKMHSFLLQLAKCDDLFEQGWLKCSTTLQSDLEPVTISIDDLRKHFAKGRVRQDRDKSIIEDLGFYSGRLWNRSDDEPAHVSVKCGAYYENVRTLPAPNYAWVEFPYEGLAAARILHPTKLRQIIGIVVEHWDPDWAYISTGDLFLAVYPQPVGQIVGWFTYVSDRYAELPALPSECEVTRVSDFGNLIFIKSIDRPTVSNATHVQAIRNLSEVLRKAGMLAPLGPSVTDNG